jgi:sulfatase modifying factor 1
MDLKALYRSHGNQGDANSYWQLAQDLLAQGQPHAAASAYDRAYGLAPEHAQIAAERQALLDQLAVEEHGIRFRYIPAGSFLMGSNKGDPDEQPVHPVQLDAFWIAETPLTWQQYTDILGEPAPGQAVQDFDFARFANKRYTRKYADITDLHRFPVKPIRLQYCEDETQTASASWHSHDYQAEWLDDEGNRITSPFSDEVPRANPAAPISYQRKPIVAIDWHEAQFVAQIASNNQVQYRLPSEAEWEKAARGGLIGAEYAWGNQPPTHDNCDFGHFDEFVIQQSRRFAANGYGLYAMSGGVWEWCNDRYDAEYYQRSPKQNPKGPRQGNERVLRGGSWADDAEAVRISFRMSSDQGFSATIGMRLCRVAKIATQTTNSPTQTS